MHTEPKSPCIRNCCLNDHNICLGCFRSLDEILKWGQVATSNEQKKNFLDNATKRKSNQAL